MSRCDALNEADVWFRLFCLQIYNEKKSQFEIKRNNPKDLVERVARDISKLLNNKRKALEVSGAADHVDKHVFTQRCGWSLRCEKL